MSPLDSMPLFSTLLDPPLWIVTSGNLKEPQGLVATSIIQVSISTRILRFLVALAKPHFTCKAVQETRTLTLHLLDNSLADLVMTFGTAHGPLADKFKHLIVTAANNGSPVITSAPARLSGYVLSELDLGDRLAFLIEIDEMQVSTSFTPLTWQTFSPRLTPEQASVFQTQLVADAQRDEDILAKLKFKV